MNMYEVRKQRRRATHAIHLESRKYKKIMQIDHTINCYEEAYKDLYGMMPLKTTYSNGWYYLGKTVRVRYSEVVRRTRRMMATLHEKEIQPEETVE